ncbi:MAG TPA: SMC family ATPase [Trichocoleus sp.]|jgi:exonuclease SbcC
MQILSVTLKNFKTHRDQHFTFQPGTNAICGENGAGKTSILEAIAWVMFNHRGAYKTEDLIHNGAGSAQVTIAFVSNRDDRTYQVQRCTTKGYAIYDPQLGVRLDYKNIEAEVLPWLRQQFGVAPGTDLARLFANTIGVPQGTYTVDFLQPAKERKEVFDSVLKVEEYQKVQKDSRQLEKYAELQVEKVQAEIERYSTDLLEWDSLQQRRQTLSQEISTAEITLQDLDKQLIALQLEKNRLTEQAAQVQQTTSQLQHLTAQIEGKQQAIVLLQQSVQRATEAAQVCEANRSGYVAYLQAEAALKQLDQHLKQRQILQKQKESQQQALNAQQAELTRLQLQLENLSKAEAEIEQLQPLLAQQEVLDQEQGSIAEQLTQLHAYKLEQQNLLRQYQKFQTDLTRITTELDRVQALGAEVNQIAGLEQKRDRLQEQLSRVEAAKQFEAELRQLVSEGESKRDRHQVDVESALETLRTVQQSVPLLATGSVESALTAIQAGVLLNTELLQALWRILADLSEQVSAPKLQQQLQQAKAQLDRLYQQRAEVTTLAVKQAQQAQLQQEVTHLQTRLKQIKEQLATEPAHQQRRQQLQQEVNQLGNPRARIQLLQRDMERRSVLSNQYATLNSQQALIGQKIGELESHLVQFADLEDQVEQQKTLRQTHQQSYMTVLQYQNAAEQLPRFQTDLEQSIAQIQQLKIDRAALQAEYDQLLQNYDPQQWQEIEATYSTTRSRADQITGGLPQQRKLLAELDSQISSLAAIAAKRDLAQLALKQNQKILKFITFARKVYKQAAPRITERYVQTISREADRLFRELLNRPNVALEWTNEYEIVVQEGAHSRRFINLSGGEQMCAALAVRLALLRILADIDIAFFDEPTTNMDRPRREHLAEAIANIKSFRQLFVISHDDTFEKVTENVIFVEREASIT